MGKNKPNILLIYPDQWRHDVLGCTGHPLVKTPVVDKLAANGARFARTWCQSPICQPSRLSLITGRYPTELKIDGNIGGLPGMKQIDDAGRIDPEWSTVMKQLQGAGYETATIGKTHYHNLPSDEAIKAAGGIYDLRQYDEFVGRFGWDHVVEEYDKYTHAVPELISPYTEYLRERGLLDDYVAQIKSIFRITPTHWRGETSCLPQEHDLTCFLANETVDWLRHRRQDKPFFLKLAFVQPHVPLVGDPQWAEYYADANIDIPALDAIESDVDVWRGYLNSLNKHSQAQTITEEFVRRGTRQYFAMISLLDQAIGTVLSQLKAADQLNNTWIIMSSDHGEMLGSHKLWAKMNFYNGSVQVPLIVCPPNSSTDMAPFGQVSEALTASLDITTTIADIADVAPPEGCRGQSLLPALHGKTIGRDALYSYISGFGAIRDDQYRFTMHRASGSPCELFDLSADPGEDLNLVRDAAHRDRIVHYTDLLQQMEP